jgi:hypothetical protein
MGVCGNIITASCGVFGVVGVAMTYVVWAVMSWLIFTYVRLGRPLARAATD